MENIIVNIVNTSANPLPAYATAGSSGMDLRADITSTLTLQPLERFMIPTGISLEIPGGYEAQVRPRSGLAAKQGLTCLNSPGTIDADYRGELKVIIVNLSNQPQSIEPGERVAQIVFQAVAKATFKVVEQLTTSKRGEGGFGHTGKH